MLSQPDLWDRIKRFPLQEATEIFDFKAGLIKETGWTDSFAVKAIEEYKKFIYLTCVSQDPLFRPQKIDTVWCFHRLQTKNYFEDFCRDVIGKVVPYAQGIDGGEAVSACNRTLRLYDAEFSWPAPHQIWSKPANPVLETAPASFANLKQNAMLSVRYVGISAAVLIVGIALYVASRMPHPRFHEIAVVFVFLFGLSFYVTALRFYAENGQGNGAPFGGDAGLLSGDDIGASSDFAHGDSGSHHSH